MGFGMRSHPDRFSGTLPIGSALLVRSRTGVLHVNSRAMQLQSDLSNCAIRL